MVHLKPLGGRGRVAITVAGGDSQTRPQPGSPRIRAPRPAGGHPFRASGFDCRRGSAHRGCEARRASFENLKKKRTKEESPEADSTRGPFLTMEVLYLLSYPGGSGNFTVAGRFGLSGAPAACLPALAGPDVSRLRRGRAGCLRDRLLRDLLHRELEGGDEGIRSQRPEPPQRSRTSGQRSRGRPAVKGSQTCSSKSRMKTSATAVRRSFSVSGVSRQSSIGTPIAASSWPALSNFGKAPRSGPRQWPHQARASHRRSLSSSKFSPPRPRRSPAGS